MVSSSAIVAFSEGLPNPACSQGTSEKMGHPFMVSTLNVLHESAIKPLSNMRLGEIYKKRQTKGIADADQ